MVDTKRPFIVFLCVAAMFIIGFQLGLMVGKGESVGFVSELFAVIGIVLFSFAIPPIMDKYKPK